MDLEDWRFLSNPLIWQVTLNSLITALAIVSWGWLRFIPGRLCPVG